MPEHAIRADDATRIGSDNLHGVSMARLLGHGKVSVSGARAARRWALRRRPEWLGLTLRPRRGHPRRSGGIGPVVRSHGRRRSRVPCRLMAVIRDERAARCRCSVLDISEGGMRVDNLRLPVARRVDFALEGAWLKGTGTARVVHRTDGAAGLAVERWDAALGQAVRDLVVSGLLAESTWRELYGCDDGGLPAGP
jgi:hypothetical protein